MNGWFDLQISPVEWFDSEVASEQWFDRELTQFEAVVVADVPRIHMAPPIPT